MAIKLLLKTLVYCLAMKNKIYYRFVLGFTPAKVNKKWKLFPQSQKLSEIFFYIVNEKFYGEVLSREMSRHWIARKKKLKWIPNKCDFMAISNEEYNRWLTFWAEKCAKVSVIYFQGSFIIQWKAFLSSMHYSINDTFDYLVFILFHSLLSLFP